MFDTRQSEGGRSTPIIDAKTIELFDVLAQAPSQPCMTDLEMIQKHGEYEFSRFPSKHRLMVNLGEGLTLQGYSDTWVNPPYKNIELRLLDKPVPQEFTVAFKERTGRDLVECAINESQKRLANGTITPTLRQRLTELMREISSSPERDIERQMPLINEAVERASTTDWKSSDQFYNRLHGSGYLIDISDMDERPPFSSLHPHTHLVLAVSQVGGEPQIELGSRAPLSGEFISEKRLKGEHAGALLSQITERIGGLESRLHAEREYLENDFEGAIRNSPMEDWRISRYGDSIDFRGQIGDFGITFRTVATASFEGISAVVPPDVTVSSHAGPRLIAANPPRSTITPAFEEILKARADAGSILVDRFDEKGLAGQYLLERVKSHLDEISEIQIRQYYRAWHGNYTTLENPRWQITTDRDGANGVPEYIVVSPEGISVGCWRGGQSGGYREAFVFTSSEAKALAEKTLTRIDNLRS